MNGADYLQQHSAESLSFEEMQQINPLGVHQQQKDEGSQTSESKGNQSQIPHVYAQTRPNKDDSESEQALILTT